MLRPPEISDGVELFDAQGLQRERRFCAGRVAHEDGRQFGLEGQRSGESDEVGGAGGDRVVHAGAGAEAAGDQKGNGGDVADARGELQEVRLAAAGALGDATAHGGGLVGAAGDLEVNYLALIATTQAFAPVLAANGGGAFVNVLSVASWVGSPLLSSYGASKSAAWNFTNAARVELKRQDTHVVGVHVGFVDTDLTAALDVDKIAPAAVATAALDAVEAREPEAVVDDVSRQVKAGLSDDQRTLYPQIERDFAAVVG